MASTEKEAMKQLRSLSECCICLTTYTDPRMLPCFHTACLKCFEDIQLKNGKKPGDVLPCPLCRNEFPIPADDFIATDHNALQNAGNIVGKLSESTKEFKRCAVVIANSEAAIKLSFNLPEDALAIEPCPDKFEIGSAASAAVYRNSIFVCGLGYEDKDIWRFDASSSKWSKCASLIYRRKHHSVAFVDHVLYVCGGWSKNPWNPLDAVESYNTFDDRCSDVGKLVYRFSCSGNCVPFHTSLYIFGGFNVHGEIVSTVQVYDTTLNTCTLLTKQMPKACFGFCGELWENCFILLGKSGCFIYDNDTQTWKVRDKFKLDNFYSGVTVNDGKLFVIGGGANKDDVRWIPIANILNDELIEWRHYAKLPITYLKKAFFLGKLEYPM